MAIYAPRIKTGRCRNGYQRDRGKYSHAVPEGRDWEKALCGVEPGRLTSGWAEPLDPDFPVTCPKCLKRLMKG